MKESLDRFQEILENGLVKVCGMSGIPMEMMASPDIDEKWNNLLIAGYTADAVDNFNDYPQAAFGFAAYLGMAVANQWHEDWERFKDAPYDSYYGNRGFDDMDDHIAEELLGLNSLISDKLKNVVLNCTQAAQDLLRHESVELQSEYGFYILVRCCSALYRIGASLELYRLGYQLTRCEKQGMPAVPKDAVVAEKMDIEGIEAKDIPQIFKAKGMEYHTVSVLNWPEQYPYLPAVSFAIAHNGTHLLIHYRVTEKRTLGTMVNDLDPVYNNSCCEFFCMNEGDSLYYNIESNCLGSILMGCGSGRKNRSAATLENLQRIDRWASLGRDSIGLVEQETHWELALAVPVTAFWCHDYATLSGKTFLVNVYNCVGSGDEQQYVSWNPIDTPAPDFHRPEFFRRLYFAP